MPLLHATLDIHFLEAPETMLEQIRSTQDAVLTATVTPNWKHYHWFKSGSTKEKPIDPFPSIVQLSVSDKAAIDGVLQHASTFWGWLVATLYLS